MQTIPDLIELYGKDYLICSGDLPCIVTGRICEESVFYGLDPGAESTVIERFNLISGKQVDCNTAISTLSGGQKVILMTLLALNSPAEKILFHNLMHNLDIAKREIVRQLLEEYASAKTIRET